MQIDFTQNLRESFHKSIQNIKNSLTEKLFSFRELFSLKIFKRYTNEDTTSNNMPMVSTLIHLQIYLFVHETHISHSN